MKSIRAKGLLFAFLAVATSTYASTGLPSDPAAKAWIEAQNAIFKDPDVDPEALAAGEVGAANERIAVSARKPPAVGWVCTTFHDKHRPASEGIDICGRHKAAVRSEWAGKVVLASCRFARGGCVVKIQHDNGLTSYYSHLSPKLPVRVGEHIRSGQMIGKLGLTGRPRGKGDLVHFELRNAGKPLNPLNFLRPQVPGATSRLAIR